MLGQIVSEARTAPAPPPFLQRQKTDAQGVGADISAQRVGPAVSLDYVEISALGGTVVPDAQGGSLKPEREVAAPANVNAPSHFRRQLVEHLEKQGGDLSAVHDPAQHHSSLGALQECAAPVAATMSDGTRVSVSTSSLGAEIRLTLADGRTLTVDGISSDVRFTPAENGEILMVTRDATFTFDARGDKVVAGAGGDPLTGGDGNDIIINFSSAAVQGGGGDDLVITYANRADISGGEGNDRVIVAGRFAESLNISLGDGDDSLEIAEALNADIRIDAGNGNDGIRLGTILGGGAVNVAGGDGDDEIRIGSISVGSVAISGGNGNDGIEADFLVGNGSVVVSGDDGNDVLSLGAVRSFGGSGACLIGGGAGDDKIFVGSLDGASVGSGSGNDVIRVGHATDSVIDGGDGDNEISVETMFRSLLVNGLGNDAISIDSMISSMILSPESLKAGLWEQNASPRERAPLEDGQGDDGRDAARNRDIPPTFGSLSAQRSFPPGSSLREAASVS